MTADPTAKAPATTLGDLDLYLFGEGHHFDLADHLGAHPGPEGTTFAVWAPAARAVHVVGDHMGWDPPGHALTPVGSSGVWAGTVADAAEGDHYRYRVTAANGHVVEKADPMAFAADVPPATASVVATRRTRAAS